MTGYILRNGVLDGTIGDIGHPQGMSPKRALAASARVSFTIQVPDAELDVLMQAFDKHIIWTDDDFDPTYPLDGEEPYSKVFSTYSCFHITIPLDEMLAMFVDKKTAGDVRGYLDTMLVLSGDFNPQLKTFIGLTLGEKSKEKVGVK